MAKNPKSSACLFLHFINQKRLFVVLVVVDSVYVVFVVRRQNNWQH